MSTPYKPSWSKHEKDISSSKLDTALNASDAFEQERAKELATSAKARNWEKARKLEWKKAKPKWVKERQKKEQEPFHRTLQDLKKGGTFESVNPMPGYVLVEIDPPKEYTSSGIALSTDREPNTGTIVKVSANIIVNIGDEKKEVSCPVEPGDRVLFKKYAGTSGTGLELVIKGEDYRLMRWNLDPQQTDLLGIIE